VVAEGAQIGALTVVNELSVLKNQDLQQPAAVIADDGLPATSGEHLKNLVLRGKEPADIQRLEPTDWAFIIGR
jgi:hypothetical protein